MSTVRSFPTRAMRVLVNSDIGEVSACLSRPRGARWVYLLGHGAGAGMNHPFLEEIASRLGQRKFATLRYQFPYMEAGRKRPDHARVLMATVRAAMDAAGKAVNLPLIAGGKSMGGRMTSLALAEKPHPAVKALAFLGFPLHAAGKSGAERGEHLREIKVPMLFLQGTRDTLADLDLMRPLCKSLGRRATLHVVEGGDHSFKVLKRSQRSHDEVMDEITGALVAWAERML